MSRSRRRLLLDGGKPVDDAGGGGVVLRVGHVLAQELEVELDGGEGVLDFVGQPAGEGAELGGRSAWRAWRRRSMRRYAAATAAAAAGTLTRQPRSTPHAN